MTFIRIFLLCSSFIILSNTLFSQLASIDCICELEVLLLDSKIDKSEVIIKENDSGSGYTWHITESPDLDKPDLKTIPKENANDLNHKIKSNSKRKRTKKKTRRKTKRKKKKFKKNNGGCPIFK